MPLLMGARRRVCEANAQNESDLRHGAVVDIGALFSFFRMIYRSPTGPRPSHFLSDAKAAEVVDGQTGKAHLTCFLVNGSFAICVRAAPTENRQSVLLTTRDPSLLPLHTAVASRNKPLSISPLFILRVHLLKAVHGYRKNQTTHYSAAVRSAQKPGASRLG